VLRFNISTVEEEAALSEAADTLFLDVWEFTHNWADIRLREDDVWLITRLLVLDANHGMTGTLPPWTATEVLT
jgi:extracellular matrix protein 14